MKRSEAVSLVESVLRNSSWIEDMSLSMQKTLAEEVLYALEEAGMSPPVTRDPVLFRETVAWEPESGVSSG